MATRTFRSRFWAVAGAASIRLKIMGVVVAVTLLLGAAVVVLVSRDFTGTLERELEQRGIALAVGLAARSQELVLTDRLFALYTMATETVRDNPDVRYVFVTDRQGAVLVHTFTGGIPADLLARPWPGSPGPVVELLASQEGPIRSIAAPILGGRAGTVHLGMSEARLQSVIRGQVRRILLATLGVLVVGALAGFGLATVLARPLAELARAAEAVGRGDFTWRPPRWAHDEIGRLGASFAAMAERLARFRDELRRRDEIRTRLLEQVMTAQEEERRRIARELHDETGQALTSLSVGLAVLAHAEDVATARARARDLGRLAERTLDEVHALSRGLRPSVLDDLGLRPALERHAADVQASRGLAVDLHTTGLDGRRLPAPVETAVYRIVQEALTNAARHAAASTVSVLLDLRPSSLQLIVEDNGAGFDVAAVAARDDAERHLGLDGMRERAALLGGTLTVESTPGTGTTVFAEIPLAPDEAA